MRLAAATFLISLLPLTGVIASDPGFDPCAPGGGGETSTVCKGSGTGSELLGPNGILRNGLQVFVYIVGFASLVMITIGGFRFVLAAGDPQKAAAARNTLIYSVIGLVIALSAQGILTFIIDRV
ncbi:MAG: pilin [Candidatus Saccharimonadales bacterium]|nr:pilin [Candidatus Saccharimonadales bacterium]